MLRIRSTGLVAGLLVITGCAWFPTFDDVIPDKQKEYQKSQSLPDLEVPPDLTTESIRDTLEVPDVDASGAANYSTYQERIAQRKKEPEAGSAESPSAAKLGALADETQLIIDAEPAVVWAELRPFWEDRGYALDLDDEEGGVLETGWVENRAKQERDRFKVILEAGEESGTTVLYLTHVGEALTQGLEWRERPRDAGLEGRMAAHLKKALSGQSVEPTAKAEPSPPGPKPRSKPEIASAEESGTEDARADLLNAGEGKAYLRVANDFAKVWRNTGFALGQIGAKVEDEDRSRGSYYLRFSDTAAPKPEKGFLSSLAFWRDDDDDEFEIHLTDVGNNTEVIVLDPDGNWDNSATAARILRLLRTELNK
ncbi:MAG: Outer membrane protein assembly factor BamC [Chromatiales bacterium USCg_Taylor]|nr:MAG: Outer membrane protein assembly factor BamC [Chromatiales bacterium USCg_Taylor]